MWELHLVKSLFVINVVQTWFGMSVSIVRTASLTMIAVKTFVVALTLCLTCLAMYVTVRVVGGFVSVNVVRDRRNE